MVDTIVRCPYCVQLDLGASCRCLPPRAERMSAPDLGMLQFQQARAGSQMCGGLGGAFDDEHGLVVNQRRIVDCSEMVVLLY